MADTWHERLLALWAQADRPSSRKIAAQVGFSHVTVNAMIQGHRPPRHAHLIAVVQALGGDPADFRDAPTRHAYAADDWAGLISWYEPKA